jgi:4-hydroxy-4-methyl-2-oxoglutarate aldolase
MDPGLRPLLGGQQVAGPALTGQCQAGDNTVSHVLGVLAEPGDVLVVAGGDPQTALWGDLTSAVAKVHQVAAVVVDGGVRDVRVIRELGLPVWSRTITASRPTKATPGSANVPVRAGGVLVEPGDIVVADDDGVVVVPRRLSAEILARAEAREAREVTLRAGLIGGNPRAIFEGLGIQQLLDAAGVETIDDTYEGWRKEREGAR